MAIVRIIAPQQTDRLKSLANGICRFGADFGCDVVLIDDGILPEHFTMRLDDGGVSVLVHPGAEAELCDRNGQRQRLECGVVHAWPTSHALHTAGLEVHLGGAPVKAPEPRRPVVARLTGALAGRPRLSVLGVTSVVALLLMGNADTGALLTQSSAAISGVPMAPRPAAPPPDAVPAAPGIDMIGRTLSDHGLTPHSLQAAGDMAEAVFYLDSVAERDAAGAVIAGLGLPVRPRFHLRTQMLSGVRIILDGTSGKAELVSLIDGAVVLGGLRADDTLREAIRSRILGDVPGIRSVDFADPATAVADDLARDISAVWLGDRPYVVLTDGRIIRPGQVLNQDVSLVRVLSGDRISVRMNGLIKEVTVR